MRLTVFALRLDIGAVQLCPSASATVSVTSVPVTTFSSGDMDTVISLNLETSRCPAGSVTFSLALPSIQVRWVLWFGANAAGVQ